MTNIKRFFPSVAAARVGKPTLKPRTCDVCGAKYHRRNLIEAWPTRNPGHRIGWFKVRQRVCLACMSTGDSARMLRAVGARWIEPKKEEK